MDEKFGDLRGVELAEADLEKMGLGQLEPAENEGAAGCGGRIPSRPVAPTSRAEQRSAAVATQRLLSGVGTS